MAEDVSGAADDTVQPEHFALDAESGRRSPRC
jgi:hypothetical protein